MKLTPVLAVAVALCGGVVLGYWGAVQHVSPTVERWVHRGDSLELAIQVRDAEAVQEVAEVTRSLTALRDSLADAAKPLPPVRAPLPQPSPNLGTASDSAAYWRADALAARARADSQAADADLLRAEIARQRAMLEATGRLLALSQRADSLHTAERDSLRQHIREAPQGRPRGVSLFGVRLCPTVGASYSVIPGVGQGFGASIVQPISCGG